MIQLQSSELPDASFARNPIVHPYHNQSLKFRHRHRNPVSRLTTPQRQNEKLRHDIMAFTLSSDKRILAPHRGVYAKHKPKAGGQKIIGATMLTAAKEPYRHRWASLRSITLS